MQVTIGVRPQHVVLADSDAPPHSNAVARRIASHSYSGNLMCVVVSVADDAQILVETGTDRGVAKIGTPVAIGWKPARSLVLPP